jgi:polyisoprenoid-binding protein YceI
MTSTSTGTESATSTTWQIDPVHSLVEFSVRHMMVSNVKGRFTGVKGTIIDVHDDPTQSSVEVEIDPASITTGTEQRDGHLKSADFFDVEKYPVITFKSSRIEGTRDEFKLHGNVTVKDQIVPVVLDATFNGRGTNPYGKEVAGFSAEARLNRKDFGLNWNVALEAGGVLVSDHFKLTIEVEAVKQD